MGIRDGIGARQEAGAGQYSGDTRHDSQRRNSIAGGFDTSAKDTAIRVTRRTSSGQTVTREINLREAGSQGRIEQDIVVLPDDVVFVPELIF